MKLGKTTLSISILHLVLLYGSFFGIGLKSIGKVLAPLPASMGAVGFLVLVVFISFNYTSVTSPIKKYAYGLYRQLRKSKN
jgi:hypothetical protein